MFGGWTVLTAETLLVTLVSSTVRLTLQASALDPAHPIHKYRQSSP